LRGFFLEKKMDEMLEPEDIAGAKIDLENIRQGAAEDMVVTPRSGLQYESLPRVSRLGKEGFTAAIQKVENVGGYISVPTLPILNAYMPLYNYQLARVEATGDEYRWDPTVTPTPKWVATGRNYLNDAKLYIDKSIKKGPAKPFFAVVAANDAPVFWVDENCELWTFGAQFSINQLLALLQDKSKPLIKNSGRVIFNSTDLNGDSYFRIGQNGYLYLFDQQLSVQEQFKAINDQSKAATQNIKLKSVGVIKKRDLYNADYLERLNSIRAMSPYVCPVPRWMSKQRFTLGQNWVNDIKLTVPSERVVIAGYDPSWREDIGVVHPQIIEFEQQMAGYKWWMSINPYTGTNEDIEWPYIYGSNDPELKKWELISGFPTPFDRDPPNINGVTSGFLSDSGFVYDVKRGELILFWRRTLRYDGQTTLDKITNEIVAKATCDGKNWSDFIWLRDAYFVNNGSELDEMLSPNIVYNPSDDLYYLYAISNGKLYYRTAEDVRSRQWSAKTEAILNGFPTETAIWHFDMRFVGDKLVAALHVDSVDSYYCAVSDDMHNFVSSPITIITNENPNLYKPTFLPILSDSTFKLRFIFTSDQASTPRWQLKVADTTVVSIGD